MNNVQSLHSTPPPVVVESVERKFVFVLEIMFCASEKFNENFD